MDVKGARGSGPPPEPDALWASRVLTPLGRVEHAQSDALIRHRAFGCRYAPTHPLGVGT
jgi:hypothetical protein